MPTTQQNPGAGETTRGAPVIRPATDIYETDTHLVLTIEMPGVDVESTGVTLDNQELSISAAARLDSPTGYTLTHEEFSEAHYARAFTLSDAVDGDSITASMKDGILKLTLAKARHAATRRIAVKAG